MRQWWNWTILSFVVPFSSFLQSFPASGSFPMSAFFASGGQSIGASASASVLPMNTQDWPPLGWTGWISLQSLNCQESSPTPQFKSINYWCSAFFMFQLSHSYMTIGKTMVWLDGPLLAKQCFCFLRLSRWVIAFLLRSKCLLISWLQSPSAVILEPGRIKSLTVSIVSPSICYEVMGPDAMIVIFWMLSFKLFHSLLSLSSRGYSVPLCFLP